MFGFCSLSLSSGNLVDGLPLSVSTAAQQLASSMPSAFSHFRSLQSELKHYVYIYIYIYIKLYSKKVSALERLRLTLMTEGKHFPQVIV